MTTPPSLIPLRICFGTPTSVYIGLSEAFLFFNGPMVVHTTPYYYLNHSPIDGHLGYCQVFTVMTSFTPVKYYTTLNTCADISLE